MTPFLNLVVVWNRGVSFGMLDSAGALMPWLLSGLALAVVAALVFWLRRVKHPLAGVALGLIIGGALGNVIDRIRFGAVVDFLDFHAPATTGRRSTSPTARSASAPLCCWSMACWHPVGRVHNGRVRLCGKAGA